MKPENFSELAALYALDILDESDCQVVEETVLEFPELEMELAEFRNAAGAIAYTAPDVIMATNLKQRLFQSINKAVSINTLKKQAAQVTWKPYSLPGVMIGILNVDEDKREISCFLRCESDVRFPRHGHFGNEEIIMLEGDLVIDGKVYISGDRIYSFSDTIHEPETPQGCLLFLKTSSESIKIR